jgi:hypothetical protein
MMTFSFLRFWFCKAFTPCLMIKRTPDQGSAEVLKFWLYLENILKKRKLLV